MKHCFVVVISIMFDVDWSSTKISYYFDFVEKFFAMNSKVNMIASAYQANVTFSFGPERLLSTLFLL